MGLGNLMGNIYRVIIFKNKKKKKKNGQNFSIYSIFNEFHFLIDCQNYKKLRESALESIQDTEHIDLSRENITKKLRELFSNGSLRSLYVLGKFVKTAMESRGNSQT